MIKCVKVEMGYRIMERIDLACSITCMSKWDGLVRMKFYSHDSILVVQI